MTATTTTTVTPQVERCPGSRSFAGLRCRGIRTQCRVCRLWVDVVQNDDGGAGGWIAVHDREMTR